MRAEHPVRHNSLRGVGAHFEKFHPKFLGALMPRSLRLVLVCLVAAFVFAPAAAAAEPIHPREPEWIEQANVLARRIVAERLFITADTIQRKEAAALAAKGPERLNKLAEITSQFLIDSDAEKSKRFLELYESAAAASNDAAHMAVAKIMRGYLPALDNGYQEAVRNIRPTIVGATDPFVLAMGGQIYAIALADSGQPGAALQAVMRGLSATANNLEYLRWQSSLHSAWSYAAAKFQDNATSVAHDLKAIEIDMARGEPIDGATLLYNLAIAASKAGDHTAAIRFAGMFQQTAPLSGRSTEAFFADSLCAAVRLKAEQLPQALACARAAMRNADAPVEYHARLALTYVEALARSGDGPGARQALKALKADIGNTQESSFALALQRLEAEVEFAEGDHSGAFAAMRAYATAMLNDTALRFNAGVKELRASLEEDLARANERAAAEARESELMEVTIRGQTVTMILAVILLLMALGAMVVLRNSAKRLAVARATADAANRSKSEFLAAMSHELRTPMNGVLGMAQSLAASPLSPQQREQLNIIRDSGDTLMALLNDVLDLSKIEAGKLDMAPVDYDLRHALKRAVQLFDAQARDKGVKLSLNVDAAVPSWVRFDPVRVRQCIANLVSNAVKFTSEGEVNVNVSAVPLPGGDGANIRVQVRDTGMGMSAATLAKLFQPYMQAAPSVTRQFGGTGLGLAISRNLAQLMGGDVEAVSVEGAGTTMSLSFVVHAAQCAAPKAPPPDTPDVERMAVTAQTSKGNARAPLIRRHGVKTVLIVDDVAVNRKVAMAFLAPLGVETVEASSGAEALDLLGEGQFDLVLMDSQMPGLDGIETTRRLRALTNANAQVPVIALTAEAMHGDREKFLAAGLNDYVSKPLDARTLHAAVLRALNGTADPIAASG